MLGGAFANKMMFFLRSVRLNVLSVGIAPSCWDAVVVEMKKILGVLEHIMIFFFESHSNRADRGGANILKQDSYFLR